MGKLPFILAGLGLSSALAVSGYQMLNQEDTFVACEYEVPNMQSVTGGGSYTQSVSESVASSSLRNVMYYSDWSIWEGQSNYYPQDLPSHLYTHLNFCFLDFDSAGNLMFTDTDAAVGASLNQDGVTWGDVNAGILPVLRAERAENPNMKLGVSVGGWSKSGDFSTMTANNSTRATFVTNMMKFLEYTDFDYIDIDWEYPAVVRQPDYVDNALDEGTPAASSADKENYIKLLQDLRTAMDEQGERLGKNYELSVALPMSQEKLEVGIDIPAMFQVIDFANVMTYDARGAFDTVSGHHSPLYGNPADPMYEKGYSVDQSVQYLLEKGAPSEKIVIGAAFYSRGWENIENKELVSGLPGLFSVAGVGMNNADTSSSVGALNDIALSVGEGGYAGGVWAYRNFDNLKASYPNLVEYWDDVAKAPYLYNGSAFFTYDNPQSLAEKANYVLEHNLGGIISWQAGNDAVTYTVNQRDLLSQAIYDHLYQGSSLEKFEVVTTDLDISVAISTYTEEWSGSGLEITIKNMEQAQEVGSVLKEIELQKETIQLGKLYIDCGGVSLSTGGYGSGDVSQIEGFTVVDLATVYENKNIKQGESITFRLKCDSGEISEGDVNAITLTQRVTSSGTEISAQVIYGNGVSLPSTTVPSMPSTGTTTPDIGTSTQNTETTPPDGGYTEWSPAGPTDEVLSWSRELEATGACVPGQKVSYLGKIYLQVADSTLWWEEPSMNSSSWSYIEDVDGYEAPAPTVWSREEETNGAYTPGVQVTHQGKTYLQVSSSTSWWCEPGTDEAVWQVIS